MINLNCVRLTLLIVLALGFCIPRAYALEHWYAPVENQLKTLVIENPSSQSQDLWISGPLDQPTTEAEIYYEIPAKSQIEVSLDEFQEFPWIHLKAKDLSPVQMSMKGLGGKTLLKVQQGNSDHWDKAVIGGGKLILLNTSALSQNILVKTKLASKSYQIASFGKLSLNIAPREILDLQGDQRFTALFQKSHGLFTYLDESKTSHTLSPNSNSKTAYFLFTNPQKTQSFVVQTDNDDLKIQARNQIIAPDKYPKRILVASIGAGHGDTNRDFYHRNKSPWSWHVSQALTFADYASQDCDGSPEFVDEFAKIWLTSPGAICFWSYKISEELSLEQVRSGLDLKAPPYVSY